MFDKYRELAKKALEKSSPYGPDVDLSKYDLGSVGPVENLPMEELPRAYVERAKEVGIDAEERKVSGTYFQVDHSVARTFVEEKLRKLGVVVTSTLEALRKYDWVKEYYWRAVPVDLDKYTAITELEARHGYFIYVPPGVKVEEPIQACLFISRRGIAQPVHNIIIVDEGAELNLVTGCTTIIEEGLHIGVSEFYVGRNAKISFTMIHGWSRDFEVRPRTGVVVEEGGEFVNYYINLNPAKTLQMLPTVYLKRGSSAYLTSVVLASGRSYYDVGGRLVFQGEGARGEIISRSVVKDFAKSIMRGELIAQAPQVRGHLECRGLVLSDEVDVVAIPILRSGYKDVELTHEAAIGRISEDELIYLMSKGFDEEEATSLIVRGFVDVGLDKVPESLRRQTSQILELLVKYARM